MHAQEIALVGLCVSVHAQEITQLGLCACSENSTGRFVC